MQSKNLRKTCKYEVLGQCIMLFLNRFQILSIGSPCLWRHGGHSVILRQLLQLMCLACLAIIGQGKIVNWRPWQSRTKTMVQKEIRMLVIPQAMPNALVVSYYPRGRHFFYPTLGTLKNREEESHQVLGGDMLDFGR